MAALVAKEDSTTGTLTLTPALMSRLGSLAFGLLWIGFIAIFILPTVLEGGVDLGSILFVLVFALVPISSSFLNALISSTVTIDRNSRTLASVRQLLVLPISTTTLPFGDIASIQVQTMRASRGRSSGSFRVDVVDRSGRRIPINWNGTQKEMDDLAQKISALTGVQVSPASYGKPLTVAAPMMPNTIDVDEAPPSDDMGGSAQQPTIADESTTSASPPTIPVSYGGEAISPPMSQMPVDYSMSTPSDSAGGPLSVADLASMTQSELESRIKGDSMDSDSRYALARKLYMQGKPDQALSLYQETMRLDPTNSGAQNDIGVALESSGKRTEAEAAYRRAIALDPFSSTAHLNLALLLRQSKRAAEASQEFFQARQNARGDDETRAAESASTGAKMGPLLSKM